MKIETYQYIKLYKNLQLLSTKNMTASGIHISLTNLDGSDIGEMQFIGEMLPELIPVLCKSIYETIKIRNEVAKRDVIATEKLLYNKE